MYYIKQTYPYGGDTLSNIYFQSWIENFKITEKYTNWNLKGDDYIYSNSFLPNYSFSLNIDNHLFSLKNINLIWKGQVVNKNKKDNEPAFNITKYEFNTNINLSNSHIFNHDIKNENIFFNFTYNFNQDIFADFKIDYTEDIRRKFVDQVNLQNNELEIDYSNTYILSEETNSFSLMNNDEVITFNVPNFFAINQPLNQILYVNKNNNLPFKIKELNIKFEYKVVENNESFDFEITKEEINRINSEFSIDLDEYLNYDVSTNKIEQVPYNSFKGIFIPKNVIGTIQLNMIFEHKNMVRKLEFNRQFYFDNNYYENCYNSIFYCPYNYNLAEYQELIYG